MKVRWIGRGKSWGNMRKCRAMPLVVLSRTLSIKPDQFGQVGPTLRLIYWGLSRVNDDSTAEIESENRLQGPNS